ncbi:hypothetical protein LINPERHAP2_LOCUS24272 [Linum perenne]
MQGRSLRSASLFHATGKSFLDIRTE